MRKLFLRIVLAIMLVTFAVPVIAGEVSRTSRYESYDVFEIWIFEVRDTRGTLGYKTYDDRRYKSTDGNRYKISVDYNSSSFNNCKVDPFLDEVTARKEGDWSWTKIRVEAIDRMKPFSYSLKIKYKQI